ncbi:MAG: BamA/TamA family outer membrane protein [Ignavibacteria bacterium]
MRTVCIVIFVHCSSFLCLAMEKDSLSSNISYAGDMITSIDTIIIKGNELTENDIILRELTFKAGDIITVEQLKYNRERIYSLSLFTSVKLRLETINNRNTIFIDVKESWYIWPIPFFEIMGNSLNMATYGLNAQYNNFRGRNETLRARAGFGYDPNFKLSYFCPYLFAEQKISFSTELSYLRAENISRRDLELYGEKFSNKVISGNISFVKRFNLFNSAGLLTGYDYIETPRHISGISASEGRIDRVPNVQLSYSLDTRDLRQFPDSGLSAGISYLYKGFGINKINYSILSADYRQYIKLIGELSAKWRFASRLSFGNVPFYDHSFLGFSEKVRGHSNEIKEGNYSYIASFEIKYPLLSEWDLSIDIPPLPQKLTSCRIGIYPYFFTDAGCVQLKNEALISKNFYSGYGIGIIILLLPYNILRCELAFDEYQHKEFLFGLGFSF